MSELELYGRQSSLFTRVPRWFAHELGLELRLMPILDMTETDEAAYGGNPALKLPTLRYGGSHLFGAQNICRRLCELSPAPRRVIWPEQLTTDLSRNAQELVWHAMSAQVQLVFGTQVAGLAPDTIYFSKARLGLDGALRWLERHLPRALQELPERDFSLLEVELTCLLEHLEFRGTRSLAELPGLSVFARAYGGRAAARATAYAFDAKPRASQP